MKETNEWHLVRLAEYCDGPPTTWQKLQLLYGEFAMDLMSRQMSGTLDEFAAKLTSGQAREQPPWNIIIHVRPFFDDAYPSQEILDWIAEEVGLSVSDIEPFITPFDDFQSEVLTPHGYVSRTWYGLLLCEQQPPTLRYISWLYASSLDFTVNWFAWSPPQEIDHGPEAHWEHVRYRTLENMDDDHEIKVATELLRVAERLTRVRMAHLRWGLFSHLVPHYVPMFCRGEVPPLPNDLTLPIQESVGKLEDKPKHVQKAVKSYIEACKAKPELWESPSRDVYEWLRTHEKKPEQSLETWQRYVREGSEHIEEAKRHYHLKRGFGAKPTSDGQDD